MSNEKITEILNIVFDEEDICDIVSVTDDKTDRFMLGMTIGSMMTRLRYELEQVE